MSLWSLNFLSNRSYVDNWKKNYLLVFILKEKKKRGRRKWYFNFNFKNFSPITFWQIWSDHEEGQRVTPITPKTLHWIRSRFKVWELWSRLRARRLQRRHGVEERSGQQRSVAVVGVGEDECGSTQSPQGTDRSRSQSPSREPQQHSHRLYSPRRCLRCPSRPLPPSTRLPALHFGYFFCFRCSKLVCVWVQIGTHNSSLFFLWFCFIVDYLLWLFDKIVCVMLAWLCIGW